MAPDVGIAGSDVLAIGDVPVEAGRDVAITSATSTYSVGADSFSKEGNGEVAQFV